MPPACFADRVPPARPPGQFRNSSWRCDFSVHVPEIFPGLTFFPEEHLTFNQPAIPIDAADVPHFRFGKRFAHGALKIAQIMGAIGGKSNRKLSALDRPLYAHDRGVHIEAASYLDNYWILDGHCVFGRTISLRPARRADRAIANRNHAIELHKRE